MLLFAYRAAKGLTQEQMATRWGVSQGAYSRYERRVRVAPPEKIIQLYVITDGHVGPADHYELPQIPAGEAGDHGPAASSPGVSSWSTPAAVGKHAAAGDFAMAAGD